MHLGHGLPLPRRLSIFCPPFFMAAQPSSIDRHVYSHIAPVCFQDTHIFDQECSSIDFAHPARKVVCNLMFSLLWSSSAGVKNRPATAGVSLCWGRCLHPAALSTFLM